jgi:hypothetical protein
VNSHGGRNFNSLKPKLNSETRLDWISKELLDHIDFNQMADCRTRGAVVDASRFD